MAAHTEVPVPDLADMLIRLIDARRAMARVRRAPPAHRSDTEFARHALIDALEAYTSGLDSMHRPVPYRLRDELRLNRAVDTGT